MALSPSSVPLRVPLPSPPASTLADGPDPEGECALGTHVLEVRQEDFECLAAAVTHLVAMLLAPEGDPDAPDISTSRSYAEAITGPYSSQWQTAMDVEMASWKSIGTYVDAVPPSGANIVDGMWILRVKRQPGSPPAFKARYVARGFSQRQGVDFFQTFSPNPKMTTLRVILHVATQRDYELHSLEFSTAFLQGSLHEEIWLRHPPGFTGSFPAGTQWSLRRSVYGLRQVPREWHDTLRTTLATLGFAPSTTDPSLFLRTDTSLPPFYVLMYVDDLVFAIADTEALALVKSQLQKRRTCTDLSELRSYLGLQITRDRARRTITLTYSHMVHHVLQRFGFRFSSPQSTPLPTSPSLLAPPSDESSDCPPSVGGECALGTDVLEDKQEDFECLAAAVPHLVAMLLAPEGDPDAPDIQTPHSYAEAITVPPPGANIVDGMWILRVKWPPGSPPVFKARYVARGFSQRQGVDFFQTFSPTPKMTTLSPCEWHDTLRTPLVALGFALLTADPSLFLCTDTSLLPFYILAYVDDLVFATGDTEALALVKSELQKRHTCTDLVFQRVGFRYSSPQSTPLPTGHSPSAPPLDESVEPCGPYPELGGCLMYLMTCTRPGLAYPLSILARYVAPGRHRPKHWEASKRVLCYLCSTSSMGLVLGGRGLVVLTGHADTSWVDDLATSSCEAEIYAGAMSAQELRWLTYLLTDLGEPPRSSPNRGKLHLAYVATRSNTADILTKELQPSEH
ncbi:unnamed protein product [Closterium sp. NIES-53]